MTATVKNSTQSAAKRTRPASEYQEPKRLSKLGQWRRDNPDGILVVLDRRAVNR